MKISLKTYEKRRKHEKNPAIQRSLSRGKSRCLPSRTLIGFLVTMIERQWCGARAETRLSSCLQQQFDRRMELHLLLLGLADRDIQGAFGSMASIA